MNFFNYTIAAIRTLPAKGRRNGLKILTLGIGLSVSLVLLTKVCFEQTFDNFYDGAERICFIKETGTINGQEMIYGRTSGGIAPRMKEFFPQVEEAARGTFVATDTRAFVGESKQKVSLGLVIMADSCYFKILNRPCLAGNLVEALGIEGNVVISESLADRIADSNNPMDAIGKTFCLEEWSDKQLTVAGVYADFPANASYRPDAIISLPSICMFYSYDGTDGVLGNDRYVSLLRISSLAAIDEINAGMEGFVNQYLPVDYIKEAGCTFSYLIRPYQTYHEEDSDMSSMILILALVGVALLLTSMLNYLLIVVSASVNRGREMALRKCLGSGVCDMFSMMAAESLVHTVIACLLAVVLIYASQGIVIDLLGTEVSALFTGAPLALAAAVVLIVFAINAFVPASIYNRVPVASAFRNFRADRRIWKRVLLSVEFVTASLLCVLLIITTLQYEKLTHADLGFECNDTAIIHLNALNDSQKKTLVDELRTQADVTDATLCYQNPLESYSGNNVNLPDDEQQLFNIADGYYNDGHWLDVMGIKMVKGHPFTEGKAANEEVIIDTYFEEKLKLNTGWDDVVGKEIQITEHRDGNRTQVIAGVFEPISQSLFAGDGGNGFHGRPMAIFYQDADQSCAPFQNIIIRYHHLSPEALEGTRKVLAKVAPDKDLDVVPFKDERLVEFVDVLNVRNAILVGGIVTLLIALIGMIGYVIDEVRRRSKEIAIRRVSGAQFSEIRNMFLRDILLIAVPSVIVGCVLAAVAADLMEQMFVVQAGLPWWTFTLAVTIIIMLVAIVSDLYVRIVAGSNPAESLKTE